MTEAAGEEQRTQLIIRETVETPAYAFKDLDGGHGGRVATSGEAVLRLALPGPSTC